MSAIAGDPRPLMLGMGWFPDQPGGLDRYYRSLLEHMPEAAGILIGNPAAAPGRVTGVSEHEQPLAQRLIAFWRAAQRAADAADVVDAHFALYALAPLWVGRLRHKPAVLHFHGPWADENASLGDRSGVRRAARRMVERAAYRRTGEAIVLSSAFRQVLVERYRVSPWNVNVEPPGVDLEHFSPASMTDARRRLGLPSDGFVAVAVRRLVPRMGLELLLDAWADALARLPEPATLLLAGDGPLRGVLADAVARRGVTGSVRLLGRVSDEQLVDCYRAADVGVVPSVAHEGFGLVVIEAAACGTPSIVTAVGGLPETIAALDESLIVPAGSRDALRDRLLSAPSDLPTRAATRAYAERFGWAAVAQRHRNIVRRAQAGARAPERLTVRRTGTSVRIDRRLKVVYLDHVSQMSGGEIALLRLLPHLHGVRPHVILAEDGPLVGALHLAGVSTEVLPFPTTARRLPRDAVHPGGVPPSIAATTAMYVMRLALRLRALAPDLVHTNSLKAGVYGSLAGRLAGTPVIWHVRDRISEDYLPHPAVKLIRRMTRQLAVGVVANSHATLRTLAVRSDPVVIYSVLPEVLSGVPVPARRGTGPLTFGIVGRLAPWKGQDVFLRAFARAFPDGEERAVIVGGALFGEDECERGLVRLRNVLGLANRVEFRGHRPNVWDELSRIDVLVHASITPEPFGQVILEGMAAGVPVIAARAGGPAEILKHEVTGILCEPGSVAELADAMRRMRDPGLRDRLTAAARESLAPYSPSVVAAQLEELYERVAVRAGRRA